MPFPFTFRLPSTLSVNNPFIEGQQDALFHQQLPGSFNPDADPLNLSHAQRSVSTQFPISSSSSYPTTATSSLGPGAAQAADWSRSRKRSRGGEELKRAFGGRNRSRTTTKVNANQTSAFAAPPTTGLSLTESTGYLDTKRHRSMEDELDEEVEQLNQPPAKKRRGIAGSIVSTAVSAALIGTAVGLSVYRLWRDRGKDKEGSYTESDAGSPRSPSGREPPPPYTREPTMSMGSQMPLPPIQQQVQPSFAQYQSQSSSYSQPMASSSTSHYGKRPASTRKPIAPKRPARRTNKHHHQPSSYRPQPEFDFSGAVNSMDTASDSPRKPPGEFGGGDGMEVEDQFSSLSSKLNSLIEEGRKALGREIVVSGPDEDEQVPQEQDGWQDVDEELLQSSSARPGLSRRGSRSRATGGDLSSPRKKGRRGSVNTGVYATPSPGHSRTHSRDATTASAPGSSSFPVSPSTASFGQKEEEVDGSDHLQEAMRLARERIMAQRHQGRTF